MGLFLASRPWPEERDSEGSAAATSGVPIRIFDTVVSLAAEVHSGLTKGLPDRGRETPSVRIRTWQWNFKNKTFVVPFRVDQGFVTTMDLFSYRNGGCRCLFVVVLAEAGIFPLHAIPMGILRPWKKKCLAGQGIVTKCRFSKLGIDLEKNIGQILIIALYGFSVWVTKVDGTPLGSSSGPSNIDVWNVYLRMPSDGYVSSL
ncbi:hypothetical protein L1987_58728 [Smallanthus sonchifolius]|uniref:Uncharacterized protein n=1 Tax=Smallanthus sonchifolius TaxID=185202 RepID=A0ACB9D3H2_9ASTR|nr:hypothetical protein L1987_58728 [Smallanthus sonchifolius]